MSNKKPMQVIPPHLEIETKVLTPGEYDHLKKTGYTHMVYLGTVPGHIDPGTNIGEVYEPAKNYSGAGDAVLIDAEQIRHLVDLEDDYIELHIPKDNTYA